MKTHFKVLAFIFMAVLAFTVPSFAQTSSSKKSDSKQKAAISVAKGSIKSISDSELVVSKQVKGKETDTTFAVDANTQKEGDLKPGSAVTVHYRFENMKDVATKIQATAAKPKKG